MSGVVVIVYRMMIVELKVCHVLLLVSDLMAFDLYAIKLFELVCSVDCIDVVTFHISVVSWLTIEFVVNVKGVALV